MIPAGNTSQNQWLAANEEEMLEAGREIGSRLIDGLVVLLDGQMGAGKTTLTKGIIEGFGVGNANDVSSPTFPIVHEYRGGRTVFHLDLYRLDAERDVLAVGIEELLEEVAEGSALMLVEWGERFPGLWPPSHWKIVIRSTEAARSIELIAPD